MRLIPAFFVVAHAGHHHELEASTVMRWWSWEPVTITILITTAVLYLVGWKRQTSNFKHQKGRLTVDPWRLTFFLTGWLTLIIALLSPVDALGAILFSAHMVQHELLMVVAAPLIVLGRPLVAFIWALPKRARPAVGGIFQTRAWRLLTGPAIVTILHAIALWVWHLPSLYQATLGNEAIHAAQHLSFLLTAALFWWALIHGRYGRMGYGVAVAYVFVTAAHSGILGALIAFAPRVIYPIYESTTAQWGFDAIEDQQLAGILMWIPAGVIFTIVGVALFAAWLGEAERRVHLTKAEELRK